MTFYVSYHSNMAHAGEVEAESADEAADMAANGGVRGFFGAGDDDDLYVRDETCAVVRYSCESINRINVHREETP